MHTEEPKLPVAAWQASQSVEKGKMEKEIKWKAPCLRGCWGLNACVPLNSYIKILTRKGDSIRRWRLSEVL